MEVGQNCKKKGFSPEMSPFVGPYHTCPQVKVKFSANIIFTYGIGFLVPENSRVKRPRQPGWLTEDITEAMDKRDSLKQSRDFPNYKLWRNKVVRMLKEAKADYYMNLIEENRRDTRALWAALREISPRSNTTSVMPNTIKTGDFETSNPIDIAQTFNQVFSTIADTYVPCQPLGNMLGLAQSTKRETMQNAATIALYPSCVVFAKSLKGMFMMPCTHI